MIEAIYDPRGGDGLTVFHHGQPYTFKAGTPTIVPKVLAPVLQSLTLSNGLPAFSVVEYTPREDEIPAAFREYLTDKYAGAVQQRLEELHAIKLGRLRGASRANHTLSRQRKLL